MVVRHAPVAVEGMCYGRTDLDAAVPARHAARTVVERLPWSPAAISTSPSRRCARPASHLAEMLGLRVTVDVRLHELDYGEWDGRPWREIESEDGARLAAWMADWARARPPGGESAADLERRVRAWLVERPRIPTLAVTHAGVIRALRVILEATAWPDAMSAQVPHLEPLVFSA